ncbi:MAG TPA: lipocalin family protein [bacterium]|nr:lipocalin family protein [bacterium]
MKVFLLPVLIVSVNAVAVMTVPISTVSAGSTDHIPVVESFDPARYLGTWFELVRSDHSFERDLTHVTATYLRMDSGRIRVINRGYNSVKKSWKETKARGYLEPGSTRGEFAVMFFWPFRARYRIIELADDYSYAVVTSNSIEYFWLLSRTPEMPEEKIQEIIARAAAWGFDTGSFLRIPQTPEVHETSPYTPEPGGPDQ